MRYLNADDVRRALSMRDAIEAMRTAFGELAAGDAFMPPRAVLPIPGDTGDLLIMPAFAGGGQRAGIKLLTLCPGNPKAGLPLIHALMTVFDGRTGCPLAILDGGALTALRTGAVAGLATDLLAREDASVLTVFGAGRQARTQLAAVCCVRPIRTVRIFDRDANAARAFAADVGNLAPGTDAVAAESPEAALRDTDVVCTATTSGTPVFADADLPPGVHINAVGTYHTHRREIPGETVCKARIAVDSREAAREEAGDLAIPIAEGLLSWDDIHAELGELVAGTRPGRGSREETTLFKSVGLAIQDIAAATAALNKARELGLGVVLT